MLKGILSCARLSVELGFSYTLASHRCCVAKSLKLTRDDGNVQTFALLAASQLLIDAPGFNIGRRSRDQRRSAVELIETFLDLARLSARAYVLIDRGQFAKASNPWILVHSASALDHRQTFSGVLDLAHHLQHLLVVLLSP